MRAARALCLAAAMAAGPAEAESPLSAIDWLSRSVSTPPGTDITPKGPLPGVTLGAVPQDVSVSVLGAPAPDGLGLLPPALSGLPQNLWGLGRTEEIAARITEEEPPSLPTLRALLLTLLVAEAEAPADAEGRGLLLLARIDKLLALGAIDQADALLAKAGAGDAELFRRAFDVALLQGNEDAACAKMRATPELAPTFPARVFCLARAGDWTAAALSLRTGHALGQVTPEEEALLSRFLDVELYEGEPPLPPPERPTPLTLRLHEAIGEPLAAPGLPIAFAHADLSPRAGWKAQIEAGERLARAGVLPPGDLWALYTERQAAASGGVWARVRAAQSFEAALAGGDPAVIGPALAALWREMSAAELEPVVAALFAARLQSLVAADPAQAPLVLRLALLSEHYAHAALMAQAQNAAEAFWLALARGESAQLTPPDALARAIALAFQRPSLTDEARALIAQGRLGEALLYAMARIERGRRGDLADISEGLSVLRHLDFENAARRIALELMILERRG